MNDLDPPHTVRGNQVPTGRIIEGSAWAAAGGGSVATGTILPGVDLEVRISAPMAELLEDLSGRLRKPIGDVLARAALLLQLALDAKENGMRVAFLNADGSIHNEIVDL